MRHEAKPTDRVEHRKWKLTAGRKEYACACVFPVTV